VGTRVYWQHGVSMKIVRQLYNILQSLHVTLTEAILLFDIINSTYRHKTWKGRSAIKSQKYLIALSGYMMENVLKGKAIVVEGRLACIGARAIWFLLRGSTCDIWKPGVSSKRITVDCIRQCSCERDRDKKKIRLWLAIQAKFYRNLP
jgi:hypothetical protein